MVVRPIGRCRPAVQFGDSADLEGAPHLVERVAVLEQGTGPFGS
jgi:hypothetical protein